MGKSKNKLLIILMIAVLAVTACGMLLSACADEPVKVVLDANGGTFTGGGTTLEIGNMQPGDPLDLSSYAPTREGYTLTQWTGSNNAVIPLTQKYSVPLTARPGSTITLTAQWESNTSGGTGAVDILNAIFSGLTKGDNLHSEYTTTLTVPDGSGGSIDYSIQFASNVKRGIINQGEYDYDLGLVIRNETEDKGILGLYITDEYGVPGGLYVDTNPDDLTGETGSVYLLEDFNADYLLALIEKVPSVLPDTINGLVGGLDIFNVIFNMALKATGSITPDGNGNTIYSMSFNPIALVDLGELVGLIGDALKNVDLNPLFSYLGDVIPDSTFTFSGTMDSSGNLISINSSFVNNETGEVSYDLKGGTIVRTDRNEEALSLIPSKVQNYSNILSFGHIQLSAGVTLDTLSGVNGQVDIASLINTFVPGTLPEGVLMLNADLAYRLDVAIDLDIAQKPYSEDEKGTGEVKDENVIAIEIKDTKNNDKVIAGVYYKEGYLYVNIGQIVEGLTGSPSVWNGKGFAIPFDLPSLIGAIKNVAVDFLDEFFGTDHGMITGETDLSKADGAVVGLAMAQDGNVYISQDIASLFITIFQVLKIENASNWVNITEGEDYDSLNIIIDKALIDNVLTAIGGFGVDTSAIQIPDFGTGTISFTSGSDGLRDISVGLALKGLELGITFDTLDLLMPIEKDDKSFSEYVDEVLGDKSQYTSNLNELVAGTLSAGLKGSIGLGVKFNSGTYNLGDLLSVFGLDLGDLKIEVQKNVDLNLSLNAGLYIDETDYEKSAMYLELEADNDFTLSSEGDPIIKKGVVLGVYLYENNVILDVSNLTVLGIKLPVYKITPEDFNMAELIASLLAAIPDNDLAIDLSSVINSLSPQEQAALANLAGGGGVVTSSTRASNNDLIKITANNNLLQATATLSGVLGLLSALGLNVDFDASQFLQGEAVIDVKLEDNGALSASVTGDILTPEEGGSSGLAITLGLDLKNDWQIGGSAKDYINTKIEDLETSGWEDADDALLDGLLDQLFNSTLELSVTLPDANTGIAGLIGEVIGLIPNVSADIKALLSSIDLGIGTDEATIALKIELWKDNGAAEQIIKLGITYANQVIAEILLNEQDDLYINLSYFGLGKYVVTDSGLYTMLMDLLAGLSEDLSLGSLLGGLVDFSGNLNFRAYTVQDKVKLIWNKYGAASSVYYKVYSINEEKRTLLFDTGAADAEGFTFDEATGVYTADVTAAESYFIQVYTKLNAVSGQVSTTEQTMFDALAEPDAYAPMQATANYQTINAVTFTWQAKDPFGAAETYTLVDAAGTAVSDLAGAAYNASTFTYTTTVDLTGKTGPFTIRVNGTDAYTNISPVQGQVSIAGMEISLSEATNTATWQSVPGAARYVVTMSDSNGQLWQSTVSANDKVYSNIMWGRGYTNYTIDIQTYDKDGEVIATGSVSSSASGDIMDTVTMLLSALSIKGNLISLNVTRDILSDLIASLTGGGTITLVDASITDLDLFKGSADLTIGIYEDASMDDGAGYNIEGSLTLTNTSVKPVVTGGTDEYKEISLLYGANLVESVTSILSEGLSVEAALEISLERGDYNVVEIIGPFLPENILEYLGEELIWTIGNTGTTSTGKTNIRMNLGVYAALDKENINNSGFMVQISFPDGVSLSGEGDGNVVAGDGFVIKKGAAITIAVSNNTLVVDLSAITILGITLPIYKVDNFNMGEFVEGYLVQLERTVANMYNDGNGMLYLPDKSNVTVGADKVDFEIAFDYIGDDMGFDVVYGTKDGETAISGANVTYDEATTTHTAKGTYSVVAAEGDYIAVYAKDTNGNRYDCLKLTATKSGESIVFTVPEVAAQSLATTGLTYDNYLTIDESKLQLLVTSQTIFSLLSLVADIPANVSSMDFDVTVGVGTPEDGTVTPVADKVLWVKAAGAFGGRDISLALNAGIGIGGTVGDSGKTISDYIVEQYGKVQIAVGNTYPTKLIAGILDEVLTSTVTLSLTADAAEKQGFDLLGVAKQMVGSIINLGDTALELVAQQNGEPVRIELKLALDGAMKDDNVALNMVSLKLNYVTVDKTTPEKPTDKTTTLIGIYVYDGNLWLDLSGIGMGAVQVEASDVLDKLTGYLGSLVGGFDIDLATILDRIAEGGTYPYGKDVAGQSLADEGTADDAAPETAEIVRAIITMVSVENARIKLEVTKNIINELLSLVDAVSMSLNAEASGYLDIFAGKAEIKATIYDSEQGGEGSTDGMLKLILGLGITKTDAKAAEELAAHLKTLKSVQIDLDDMNESVANLLNALDVSLKLNVTAVGGNTNLWDLLGPILDSVLVLDNQQVIDALDAIKENGVNWEIDATNIELELSLASDIVLTEDGSAIDVENSTIVLGLMANTPLALGGAENNPLLAEGDGIYIAIYGGSLYIDLSDLNLLDIKMPVLKVGTFEVMKYIEEVAGIAQKGISDLLQKVDDLTKPETKSLAAAMALANGEQLQNAQLEMGNDITLSVALSAITQILKDTSIIDLTELKLPWEIVLTTATGGAGQLQLQLNNTLNNTEENPSGVGLEAALTLSAAFKERNGEDSDDDVRNKLITYARGEGDEGSVADRFKDSTGDLIAEVIDNVLTSQLTLELGANSSKGESFNLNYALNGLLKMLGMEGIDTALAFNLDTSKDMEYRLNLMLNGESSDLSQVSVYIGIEMSSGGVDWETVAGVYLVNGEIYVDLTSIRNGALGGGVIKVTNSAIADLIDTELNKLLSGINVDLGELIDIQYSPIQKNVEEVSTAPSLTVNELTTGALVSHLIKMVGLKNLSVALNAHTGMLKELTNALFGYAIDFVEAEGSLLLVDGTLDLDVKVGTGAFAEGESGTDPDNVYTLNATLDISRDAQIADKIEEITKKDKYTEIDLSNGATLADSLMGLLGNISLDLNVDLSLPGGVFGIGDLLNNFGLVDGGLTDANGLDLIFEPLYKDDSTDAPQGGMQLGLTLSLRLSLDAQTPENSLGMIKVSFNQDMIMGTEQNEDGTIQNKVLFEEGTDFLTVIIDGSNLYVDMSDITLLGMTMPKYHSSNFDIATFVDYVLSKALDNTDSVIYGDHKATEDEGSGEGTEGSEGTEGDVSTANLAEKDEHGNWIGLSENEAMFIGVTQNDIVAIVSFTAVEAFLNLFGMNADLGNYDANIDLTISRDENKDWMQLHFVGELDPDMYYKDAKTEGWVSISDVALGGTPAWAAGVRTEAEDIAKGAADAGSMLIEGIIDQVLNLSASLNLALGENSQSMISLASVLGYIFDQTGIDVDLSEIILDLTGLDVELTIDLNVDPDSRADSAAAIEIRDAGNDIKLIGIYLKGYDVVIDLSGISLGRFAITQSALPDTIYDIVYNLIDQIRGIDIDLDTIVDKLYDLVNEAFDKDESGNASEQNLAAPELNAKPGTGLTGNGFNTVADGQYVTVKDNGDGTTTLSWARYTAASHYLIQLYNGYDNSKTNRITDALEGSIDGAVTTDGMFIIPSSVTSITVNTDVLNNLGWLADATSKYNGAEFPSYYVFVVRAGNYNEVNGTFTPRTLGGYDVYASASNNSLLKTILGMVKIRNGAIEVDARAVMVDKLLRGVLGVSFDWAEANLSLDIVDGSAGIEINLSDGDPEQYVATESTATPTPSDDGLTLNYEWKLTAEQAKNVENYHFILREKAGDTASYGKVIELNSSDTEETRAVWTLPSEANGYKLSLAITIAEFDWLNEEYRGNEVGVKTTNLEKALKGELPLRVTAEYNVNTVSLTGGLQLSSNGAAGVEQALKDVYTVEDGVYTLAQNIQVIDLLDNTGMLSSVKQLLDGFRLEAELAIYIAEGRYDMGALVAEILTTAGVGLEGLDEVTSLDWEITEPFMLNVRLQLLIEYGTSDEDMRVALTLDTDGLRIDENNVINEGTLLGLYYNNGKALLDLTNFKIAGITLPAYTVDIKLFDLVDGMLDEMINGIDISALSGALSVSAEAKTVTVKGSTAMYDKYEVVFSAGESSKIVEVSGGKGTIEVAVPEEFEGNAYDVTVRAYADDALAATKTVSYKPSAAQTAQGGSVAQVNLAPDSDDFTALDAVVLGVSSEQITVSAAFSAVATLLSSVLSGNATVSTVAGVLNGLDLALNAAMKRDQDLTLSLTGMLNWAPLKGDGEFTAQTANSTSVKFVASKSADNDQTKQNTLAYSFAPVAGATSYTAVLTNADRSINVVGEVRSDGLAYFTSDQINFGGGSSGSYIVTVTGNIESPVNMQLSLGTAQLLGADKDEIKGELEGMLGEGGSVNFAERVEQYGSLLITGLVDTLLNTRISLSIDLSLIEKQLEEAELAVGGTISLSDIVLAIAGDIAVSAGITLDDILGSVDVVFDMDVTTIILDIGMNIDLDNPTETDLMVQLKSDINGVQDVLLGLYVYDNLLTIDLRALGLRAYTLQNFDYIVNLQKMLKDMLFGSEATGDEGLLGQYDINISEMIDGLLNPEEDPAPPVVNAPANEELPDGEQTETLPTFSVTAKNNADNGTTTLSWGAVEGADHYAIVFTDINGEEFNATVTDESGDTALDGTNIRGTSVTYNMVPGVYNVKVEAHMFDHTPVATGSRQMNGAIASVLSAVSMQNTVIKLNVTPQIINNLLAVVAPSISINAEPINVSASLDIFNGDASADVDINLKYEQPVGDVMFRLGANLSIKTAEALYENPDGLGYVGSIKDALDELGTDVDVIDFGSNVTDDAGVDAARIAYAILDALNTTSISADLNVSFKKGTYDLGAMLSGMGIEALDGVSLLWTFNEDQNIGLTIELGMYVDTAGLSGIGSYGTWFYLDIIAATNIKLGEVINGASSDGPYTINKGETILSIFGKEADANSVGTIYIDLSHLNILGLDLPVISANYKFTDMLTNEFFDIICSIMDLNSYLEADYAVTFEGDVPSKLTFNWTEVTLGNSSASPEVFYDVTVVGTTSGGLSSTIYSNTIQEESVSFGYGDIEMFEQFSVTVVSYFTSNGARRVLAENTTAIDMTSSNELETASYITPDDVYAQAGNVALARVEGVTWNWTAAGVATVNWQPYEGALYYLVSFRRVSDGAALTQTCDFVVEGKENSYTTSSETPLFFGAKSEFEGMFGANKVHPMIGASGYDYGYIVEVYAYTNEALAEVEQVTADTLRNYTPAAVGAANSFDTMNIWFAPVANQYGGATSTFHVGWSAVEGAANYSVMPYRVISSVIDGTTYETVGLTAQGGNSLNNTNLMLGGSDLSFTYYNATYTREYYVELVAYDKFGNMIAQGQMTAGLGKLYDTDKTLLPVSTIALVLDSERFGLEVQLNAIVAILEGVGVELPIDLRGFDVSAALGLDTTIESSVGSSNIVLESDDVDGFKLTGLSDGSYTLTMTYTNSGGVQTVSNMAFTLEGGNYTVTSGNYTIDANGYVNYGMRRNGTYDIQLAGTVTAKALFTVSRTINMGITGNVMVPVSGGEDNFSMTIHGPGGADDNAYTVGVTEDGRTLFWQPVVGAATYTVNVVLEQNGAVAAEETFEGLTSFVQKVDFTSAGKYTVTVTAFNAAGEQKGNPQQSIVTVTGDSGLNISISVPYDGLAIGVADDDQEDGRDALISKIEDKINRIDSGNNFKTVRDLVEHYLSDFQVTLSLGIDSFTTEINLQTIINSVLAAVGVDTQIGAPIYINTDDLDGMGVQLDVKWHIDWNSPMNSYASIELVYTNGAGVRNVMLGVYLQNNIVCADLTGVGLIGIKISSQSLYSFITNAITDAVDGLFDGLDMGEGLDFSTAIQMLLGEYPVINLQTISAGTAATGASTVSAMALADETAASDEGDAKAETAAAGGMDMTTIITGLLNAIQLNSTNVFVSATTAILDTVTSSLLGIKLGIDVDFELQVPLLKGDITADLRLDNITFEAVLSIKAMEQPAEPGVDGKTFATLDTEGSGAEAVMALLSNLPLNLTVELANATMDSAAYAKVTDGEVNGDIDLDKNWLGHATYPAGTRIGIQVVQNNGTSFNGSSYNLLNSFTADAGDIVVTIATTNLAEQNSTGAGRVQYFLVVHIDISAGQISVKLCERAIVLQATALMGIEAEIDLGGGVSVLGGISINIPAIPLNINIALDLASTLGNVFDSLFSTINGLGSSSSTGSTGGNTSSGTGETVDPYDLKYSSVGGGENDGIVQRNPYEVHFNAIMNETAWNDAGDPTKWEEAYDRYIVTVSRADGSIVDRQTVEATGYTDASGGRYTHRMDKNYYESYIITVTGENDATGFGKALEGIDIWKLLGGGEVQGRYVNGEFVATDKGKDLIVTTTGGIYMNLNSTGEMNLTVKFDPYEMNKAVDAIFGSIFGADSALDLTGVSLGTGSFGINYLQFMWWDRATMSYQRLSGEGTGNNEDSHDTKAGTDPNSTLDSLDSNLRGLLADLLHQMNISVNTAGVSVSASALRSKSDTVQWARWGNQPWGAVPILMSIFMKFVPISIWTSAELNVNMSNGVLTNISFMGHDDGTAVLRYNEIDEKNEVYVYVARTLHGNGTEYISGADSNVNYNPSNKKVGYATGEYIDVKYYKSGNLSTTPMQVYAYAIPYGQVYDRGGEYYFDSVILDSNIGANQTNMGYGGYSNGRPGINVDYDNNGSNDGAGNSRLYKRGGYDVNGNKMTFASGTNNWYTTVNNRGNKNAMDEAGSFTLNSYTRLEIYNTSNNVNAGTAGIGSSSEGIVSWGNLPNRIVFDQYKMGWNDTAADYLIDNYFGNSYTARWQRGTSFARANVTFTLDGAALQGGANGNLAKKLGNYDSFTIRATANFGGSIGSKFIDITIEKLDIKNDGVNNHNGNDEYADIDDWTLYYYDELPEYIIMTTKNNERKRYKVVKEGSPEQATGDYDAVVRNYQATKSTGFAQSEEVKAQLEFRNGKIVPLDIYYLDSTLVDPAVTVDMNTLQDEYPADGGEMIMAADKIKTAIESLIVHYADGSVLTNSTNIRWGGAEELSDSTMITRSRYINEGEGSITLATWLDRFSRSDGGRNNLEGDTFYINIEVSIDADLLNGPAPANFNQSLTVAVNIPTKKPESISVHGSAADTVVLNPYDHYLYLVTGSDENNPLPSAVDVTYENGVTESVSVIWTDESGENIIASRDFVTEWYTVPTVATFTLENDETRYSFRWEDYKMTAQINSGAISTMQFLVDGQWCDSVPAGMKETTARVTFTSGYVLELPTVIRESTNGYGYAYIGYNVEMYNLTGALVEYEGCHLKQAKRIRIDSSAGV